MKTPSRHRVSRRHFIATAGTALALPLFIPGCATGPGVRVRPSNRITMGVVGWWMQGPSNTDSFLSSNDCQVVAACDLDKSNLQSAVDTINVTITTRIARRTTITAK